jgi:hypothetical protein
MHSYLSKSDFRVAQTCPTKLYYKKLGYPSTKDEDEYLELLANSGYVIEKIARLLFPAGREIGLRTGLRVAVQETMEALAAENAVLFEATLVSDHKLARVDILIKRGDEFEIIEVKSKSYGDADEDTRRPRRVGQGGFNAFRTSRKGNPIASEWRELLEDVTFQVCVLQEIFPHARISPFLMMPDRSKTTTIDLLPSLFEVERVQEHGSGFTQVTVGFSGDVRRLRQGHFLTKLAVGAEVQELMPDVKDRVEEYVASLHPELRKTEPAISLHCRDCEYRASADDGRDGSRECWGALADVTPHMLDMYAVGQIGGNGAPLANTLIQQGKVSLFDIPVERLVKRDGTVGERNKRQLIQLRHTRSNTEWVSDRLPQILRSFAYPLHFVDFETSALAVPCRAGLHPYEQVAFQWSCHTLSEPGAEPEHDEWINVEDYFPNFEFAESLRQCVGTSGTIFMWATHEATVLRRILEQMNELGHQDPGLKRWLELVVGCGQGGVRRLVDMNALILRHYFHPLMKGRTSIKAVVDAIWRTDPALRARLPEYVKEENGQLLSPYEALPPLVIGGKETAITEGTGATYAYQAMLYGPERKDERVREQWRRLLLQYCKLDTLSMVMVWWHWQRTGSS